MESFPRYFLRLLYLSTIMVLKKWFNKLTEPIFRSVGITNEEYPELKIPKPNLQFYTLGEYELFMKNLRRGKTTIKPGDFCSIDFELNKKVVQYFEQDMFGDKLTKDGFKLKLFKALATASCKEDVKWAIGSKPKLKQLHTLITYDRRSKRDYPFNLNFNYWFANPHKFRTNYLNKEDLVFVEPDPVQFSTLIPDEQSCPCERHKFRFLILEQNQHKLVEESLFARFHDRMVKEIKHLIDAPMIKKWRKENLKKEPDFNQVDWYKSFKPRKSKMNLSDFDSYFILLKDKQFVISVPHSSFESFTNKVFIELVNNGGIRSIADVRKFYAIPQISLQDFLKTVSI